ncbi:sulfate ABC transporter ATP-binding protein [Alcaligenaceae bacterium]|nr:sulfate ABC transporter ATP-binding protein [Alcaligenaceae bacterium]
MSIEVRSISKQFGNHTALDNVSLTFPHGKLTALLGPSGCGKTTLLRIIAGLEHPDTGDVYLGGENALAHHVRDRQVGFVFQHYALFRHMSVFENIAFGLRVRPRKERLSNEAIRKRVMRLLELVQLDWLADRRPTALSGGQRQRIALARALAIEPRVLLLDEPFGALDATVRKELRQWLRRLHEEIRVTSLFVTHDQDEALEVADEVVIMNRGSVHQTGAPAEVYARPATPFVYGFLGNVNLFRGRVQDGVLQTGSCRVGVPGHLGNGGSDDIAYVRPQDIQLERYTPGTDGIVVELERSHAIGPVAQLVLRRRDTQETIEVVMATERFGELQLKTRETLLARPTRVHIFPAGQA